jgi:hypothetical protein
VAAAGIEGGSGAGCSVSLFSPQRHSGTEKTFAFRIFAPVIDDRGILGVHSFGTRGHIP